MCTYCSEVKIHEGEEKHRMKVRLGPLRASQRCTFWPGNILRQQGVLFPALNLPRVWYCLNLTHAMI